MEKTNSFTWMHIAFWNKYLNRRICAFILVVCILITALPPALGEMYSESYLSLYYADATMKEGRSSGYTERFFANIAAIAMMDLHDQDFLTQFAEAVGNGYNYRVFVMHEKGMPDTDFILLYCFKDSSWLMKNTTSMAKSVYLDASWVVLEGINLKLKKEQLIKQAMPDCDDSYECNAEYVCQIFMEFFMFIEARDKALQQMLEGTTDNIPELPEEIDSWPLVIPVSVQLPKELTVLDAVFTVEPAARAAATYEQIPESQRYYGTVSEENVVTGSLSFWEAGPHLIRLVFTASIDGHKQSMSHNITIDTSNVEVTGSDDTVIDKMNKVLEEIIEGRFRAYEQDTQYVKKDYKNNEDKPEFLEGFAHLKYGSSTVGEAACGLFALMNIEHYDNGAVYSVEDVKNIISSMDKMTNEEGGGLNAVSPYTDKINYIVADEKSWIYKDNKNPEDRKTHITSMQDWLKESGQYAIISTTNQNIRNSKNNGPHFIAVLAYDKEKDRFLIADSAAMYLNQKYTYERINAEDETVTGYAWITTDDLMGWTDLAVNLMEKTEKE